MQDIAYTGESIVSQIVERIKGSARVETVYGEPITIGDKTVIPVAKVEYAFGVGAGGGTGPALDNGRKVGSGSGGGGGGVIRVRGIGVIELTAEETRLVPVYDWTRIITTAIAVVGAWMIVRALTRRR